MGFISIPLKKKTMPSSFVSSALIAHIKEQFLLDWHGVHGISHWARVQVIGRRLAKHSGANLNVVELFSFLHDSQRQSEGTDPEHGLRAAQWIASLNGRFFTLEDEELQLLQTACEDHSKGYTDADITVCTCWDADRLDLGRVGIKPDPAHLCTDIARDKSTIEWAFGRSIQNRRSNIN